MNGQARLDGTYTIIEKIGSGGGGDVYKAYHERLRKYVVVKKIKERVKGYLDNRAEVDILKNISHTCLPQVYDFLEINGDVYTVIDFIPGMSLDKVIKQRGRIPHKEVLRWAEQLADALDYLHSQSPPIVHSDIKPANIMLRPDGNICLIDFNISLAFDNSMKNSMGISGGYSPPEQYPNVQKYYSYVDRERTMRNRARGIGQGKQPMGYGQGRTSPCGVDAGPSNAYQQEHGPGHSGDTTKDSSARTVSGTVLERNIGHGIDTRSDVYSLGATLYHLLTGWKPGYDFERIIPVDQYDIEIGEGFAAIIKRMMELDPDARYRSGRELKYALQHIYELDSEFRAWKRGRRIKWAAALLALVTGLSAAACGTYLLYNERNISYNKLVTEAGGAIDSGAYERAAELLSDAEVLCPDRVEAYSRTVLLKYSAGDYEECIAYTGEVLRNAPYVLSGDQEPQAIGDIYYILGNAYIETEDYSAAVLSFESALSYYRGSSLYYRDYAIALAKTGNTDRAEEMLACAAAAGLGDDSLYMVQGEIAFARAEYKDAADYLQKTILYTSDASMRRMAVLLCDRAYRELGTAYTDEDIELLEQEISRSADYAGSSYTLHERLADAFVRKAETDEYYEAEYYTRALSEFGYLYEDGYATLQIMENIAIILEHLELFDDAEEMLLRMAEAYPDSYVPYKRLAYLEADRQQSLDNSDRDYTAMAGYYEKALELFKDQDTDQEMDMLEILMSDLEDGGWF